MRPDYRSRSHATPPHSGTSGSRRDDTHFMGAKPRPGAGHHNSKRMFSSDIGTIDE